MHVLHVRTCVAIHTITRLDSVYILEILHFKILAKNLLKQTSINIAVMMLRIS